MGERSDQQSPKARSSRKRDSLPGERADEDPILDLQRQAGNRAVAEMLQGGLASTRPEASPALRLRDALRAGRGVVQRELSLNVQRDAKLEAKADAEAGGPGEAKEERLLRVGSRGSDVAEVQALLGLTADGRFGARTRAAVVAFQRSAGLVPDGIVGPLTRAALRGREGGGAKLAEKLPPGGADKFAEEQKFPGEEAKFAGSTEKLAPAGPDKFPGEEEKFAGSTEKLPSGGPEKFPSEEEKVS